MEKSNTMGDYLQIQEGLRPWCPAPEANVVTTYNFYDVPTSGVLEHHGSKYVFLCVEGVAHPASIWTYTFADDSELAALDEIPGEELYDAVLAFMADRPSMVAIALEGPGVIAATYQEPRSDAPAMGLVHETVDALLRDLEARFERPLTPA